MATICGRRLYCPDLNAGNHFARANQERAAVNMPFQGSAADIMKIAMINVYNRIKQEKLDMMVKHLNYLLEFKDEKQAILEMRTHVGYYLKGISKEYRNLFMRVTKKEDFMKLVSEISKTL